MQGARKDEKHKYYNKKRFRYVYILDVNNRGKKSRFFGKTREFYTGQTANVGRRYAEHLQNRGCNHLKKCFSTARKKIVFVKTLVGTEFISLKLEKEIKALSKVDKRALIASDENDLVGLNIFKNKMVLRKYNNKEEQLVLDFGKYL